MVHSSSPVYSVLDYFIIGSVFLYDKSNQQEFNKDKQNISLYNY